MNDVNPIASAAESVLGLESHGHSTQDGYRVEVRVSTFSASMPVALADGLVGPEWRPVHFQRSNSPLGVPMDDHGYLSQHDLLPLLSATALAWTLLAQSRRTSLEARLVRYKVSVSYRVVREGVSELPEMTGFPLPPKLKEATCA